MTSGWMAYKSASSRLMCPCDTKSANDSSRQEIKSELSVLIGGEVFGPQIACAPLIGVWLVFAHHSLPQHQIESLGIHVIFGTEIQSLGSLLPVPGIMKRFQGCTCSSWFRQRQLSRE